MGMTSGNGIVKTFGRSQKVERTSSAGRFEAEAILPDRPAAYSSPAPSSSVRRLDRPRQVGFRAVARSRCRRAIVAAGAIDVKGGAAQEAKASAVNTKFDAQLECDNRRASCRWTSLESGRRHTAGRRVETWCSPAKRRHQSPLPFDEPYSLSNSSTACSRVSPRPQPLASATRQNCSIVSWRDLMLN